jgi:hypothetical protein
MKADFLQEPELEFGAGKHVDIRFGLNHYGPLDVTSEAAPRKIRVGLVGVPEHLEALNGWLDRCRNEIPAKQSRQPNLFPRFPGFRADAGFCSTLVLESSLQRTLKRSDFESLARAGDVNRIVSGAVDLFLAELRFLKENRVVDVFLCAVPAELIPLMDPDTRPPAPAGQATFDFHDMLKARAMDWDVPAQLILPGTYDPTARRRQKIKSTKLRVLQDEATRAWNLHTALYYKAGGLPWRLVRDASQLTTCYVGVSFYQALDRSALMTSMAQVFDERGDGIVVRGGPVQLSKQDRQAHLNQDDAAKLLVEALARYRQVHQNLPARVVIHKTSPFDDAEKAGFLEGAQAEKISTVDLLSVTKDAAPRLFRRGAYPPLRGTTLSLDERTHMVYLRGSVDFYATYPGMYIPRPFVFRCEHVEETPKHLARELLALSKMNWNDTQFDGGEPITVLAAKKVGSILKYVAPKGRVAPRYSYYM